jgi:UDP-glucose 4-epimerase
MTLVFRKFLVAGGAGFIGSHFIDHLLSLNTTEKITVVDNFYLGSEANLSGALLDPRLVLIRADATDLPTMKSICDQHSPDVYFNFATVPLPTSLVFPSWAMKVNFDLAITGCELARLNIIERYVQISSSEVYGTATEEQMTEHHPLNVETPYAASKAAADQVVLSYRRTYGIQALLLRPFNNYGPRQNSKTYAGVIPIFISKMLRNESCEIFGNGNQTRDFIFVSDTVKYILNCAQKKVCWDAGPINIASGQETSILELFRLLSIVLDYRKEPVFLPPRIGDVLRHCGSTQCLLSLTGLPAPRKIDLEGLKETCQSYM